MYTLQIKINQVNQRGRKSTFCECTQDIEYFCFSLKPFLLCHGITEICCHLLKYSEEIVEFLTQADPKKTQRSSKMRKHNDPL